MGDINSSQDVDGPVAHDGVATSLSPVLTGGYASAAAPSDVSADGDAVRAWFLRNGARACVLTAAGNLVGATSNALDTNLKLWNGVAPDAAAALADNMSNTPVVPKVAAYMVGLDASGGANADRATLATLFDLDTGAGTQSVLGIVLRTGSSGGSVEAGTSANPLQASLANTASNSVSFPVHVAGVIVDNAAFTDGTTKVLPVGYILDEVAGTALSENDTAAARIDSKRAQVMVLEDGATRGTKQTVTAGLAGLVTPYFGTRSDVFTTAGGAANGTTVDVSANPVKFFALQVVKSGAVTVWDVRLEGSIDGTNFTTILTHTNATGDLLTVWQAAGGLNPVRYFRARLVSITGGTNVTAYIVGMN